MDMSKEEIENLSESDMQEIVDELKADLDKMPIGKLKDQFKRLHEIACETMTLIKVKREAEEEKNASKLSRCITTLDNLKWESAELMCRIIRLGRHDMYETLHQYADEFQEKFIEKVVEVEEDAGYDPWASELKEPHNAPEPELDELTKLKLKMNEAIIAEDYEKAAELRDQIRKGNRNR